MTLERKRQETWFASCKSPQRLTNKKRNSFYPPAHLPVYSVLPLVPFFLSCARPLSLSLVFSSILFLLSLLFPHLNSLPRLHQASSLWGPCPCVTRGKKKKKKEGGNKKKKNIISITAGVCCDSSTLQTQHSMQPFPQDVPKHAPCGSRGEVTLEKK